MDASRFFQLLDRQERRWCDLKGCCDTSEFGRIGIRSDLDIRDLTICKAAGDREVVDTITVRLPSGANGVSDVDFRCWSHTGRIYILD